MQVSTSSLLDFALPTLTFVVDKLAFIVRPPKCGEDGLIWHVVVVSDECLQMLGRLFSMICLNEGLYPDFLDSVLLITHRKASEGRSDVQHGNERLLGR